MFLPFVTARPLKCNGRLINGLFHSRYLDVHANEKTIILKLALSPGRGEGGGWGENSTLIRRVCATGFLNLPPCSGVEKLKKCTLFWSQEILKNYVLYCIALHCIVLRCVALHCIALHCIALRCVALRCVALHCIALHCIVLY